MWGSRSGRVWTGLLGGAMAALSGGVAQAEPTEVVVRVLSHGAKFVGSSMGGAQVVLTDAVTGQVLARGTTQGSTGDTARIMGPREPGAALASPGSAAFRATLDLEMPTRVQAEVVGPLAPPQSAVRVSSVRWVLPGEDMNQGDGWLLVLPGLAVDVLEPTVPSSSRLGEAVQIEAHVTMMCGCPITESGPWPVEQFRVTAVVRREGREVARFPVPYAGRPSHFRVRWSPPEAGTYLVQVQAHQPRLGNTGVDFFTVVVADGP